MRIGTIALLALSAFPAFPAISALPALSALHAQSPDSPELSYRRALAVTQAGVDALGGDSAWAAVDGLLIRFEGDLVHRNQSRRFEPPYERTPLRGWVAYDNAGGRFGYEQEFSYPGGFDNGYRLLSAGAENIRLDLRRRTAEPVPGAAAFQSWRERMPQALLRRMLDRRAALRYAGRRAHEGRPHHVVTFATESGNVITLLLDSTSHLPARLEQLVSDATAGDAVVAVEFGDYRRAGAIMVPGVRRMTLAGEELSVVRYRPVPDAPLDSLLALPAGFTLDTVVVAPRALTPRTLAPGVHAIHGVQGNTVLAVEFADHLMVIEPPGSDDASRRVMDTLAVMVPGKPVRYVVATHFHDDHTGGVRAYMDAGATVITTPAYVPYFQQVARRAGTLNGPERALDPGEVRIETVDGRRVFEDSTRRVELIDIGPNPHTDEMLVAWLPADGILFQGDLWNPPWGTTGVTPPANATTRYFVEWLRRSGLEPRTIVGVHGPPREAGELAAMTGG